MADLLAMVRQIIRGFGRPRDAFRSADVDAFDERITTLEQHEREIRARLRLLEIAGDPQGLTHDGR